MDESCAISQAPPLHFDAGVLRREDDEAFLRIFSSRKQKQTEV